MSRAEAAELLLSARRLSAGYDGGEVVRGIDIDVHAGEVVTLLGPNGAGKTTTLLTISGLIPRFGGELDVLGERAQSRTRLRSRRVVGLARRGVAHVPENRALFFGLSARQHLRLAATDHDSGERALDPFPHLRTVADRRAGLLSGGEQQMLAIARALAMRPRLLLIDELSLGLAPIVATSLLSVVRDVARNDGVGVLLVEQHVSAALAIADRAYVMVRGNIVAEGDAATFAADPTRLAHSYLGEGS